MSLLQSLLTFGRRKKVPSAPSARPNVKPVPAEPTPAIPPLEVEDNEVAPSGTPYDQLVEWMSLNAPHQTVLTQEDTDQEEKLAQRVFEHFSANRPGPSTLPAVSMRVLNLVSSPSVSLAELTRLIAQDPGLSAGILKVANSAAYAGVQEIETLRDAVTRLGATEVGQVAGMVAARSLYQPQMKSELLVLGPKWNALFNEAVTAARVAAWLAMQTRGAHSDHAFLAGMLHDLGRPIALRSVAALALEGDALTLDSELVDRVIEKVHVEIGREVHTAWSLPRFATMVAVRHHELGLSAEGELRDLHVVRLSSDIVQLRSQFWRRDRAREEINESCAALEIDAFKLRSIDTQARTEMNRVSASFADKSPGTTRNIAAGR